MIEIRRLIESRKMIKGYTIILILVLAFTGTLQAQVTSEIQPYAVGNQLTRLWNTDINSHDLDKIASHYGEKFDLYGTLVIKRQMQKLKSDYFIAHPTYKQDITCTEVIYKDDTTQNDADVLFVLYDKKWSDDTKNTSTPCIMKWVKTKGVFKIAIETDRNQYKATILPAQLTKLANGSSTYYQSYQYQLPKDSMSFKEYGYQVDCSGENVTIQGILYDGYHHKVQVQGKGYRLSTLVYHVTMTYTYENGEKQIVKEQYVFSDGKMYNKSKIDNGDFYLPLIERKKIE